MIEFFPSRTIALEVFGWPIHWYGLMYLAGFLIAIPLIPHLSKFRNIHRTQDEWMELLTAVVIGVIVGGRLGYVIFYNPLYYLEHPLEIFAVWKGGMSSHGGFIAVISAMFYMSKKLKMSFFAMGDFVIVIVAIALSFGRIGNFINQELYGTVTTLPWGIAIPGVEGLRHPTQLYAVAKDLLIALVCYVHLRFVRPVRPGMTASIFLMMYAVLRFLVEYLRVQDYPSTDLGFIMLTRGQLLSIGIFIFGLWGNWESRRRAARYTS